jgi:hypothetical protein
MQSNIKDQVVFASPKNEEERALIAGTCVRKLSLKFPVLTNLETRPNAPTPAGRTAYI